MGTLLPHAGVFKVMVVYLKSFFPSLDSIPCIGMAIYTRAPILAGIACLTRRMFPRTKWWSPKERAVRCRRHDLSGALCLCAGCP